MTKKLYYQVKTSTDLSKLPKIEGVDTTKEMSLSDFVHSLGTFGLQASELSRAIQVGKIMAREKVPIYLSFTSNMISSGVRELITALVKQKRVAVLSTAAGGVEEDVIKAFSPFRLGHFSASGSTLFDEGVGRIGNIFVTNEQYSYLELFMTKVFDTCYAQQKETGIATTPTKLAHALGKALLDNKDADHESSYLYWAYLNNIPVFCPGIIDGAIGDFLYYYKKSHKDFVLDVTGDHERIIDFTLQQEKTAGIILGGGISKHYILNANIFKEGFDYTVYISTAQGFDGSDSGGNVEEAISWAKVKIHSPRVKVYCDASIAFPLFVAGVFGKEK